MKTKIIMLTVIIALITSATILAQDCSLNGAIATDNCPNGTLTDDLFVVTGPVNTNIVTDAGADTVNMTGGGTINTNATGHGVYDTNGGVTVIGGTITASGGWDGIWSEGDGDAFNSANINANGDGSVGISESEAGSLTNHGNISTNGVQAFGLLEVGDGDVINTGNIVTGGTSSFGIIELDAGDIINSGNITTSGNLADGIAELGNGNVTNNGLVTSINGIGINTGFGIEADTVTNNGTVTGGTIAIQTGSGNDTVINNGSINGTVSLGSGNDTMIVRNTVSGTMDGGADWDTIIFEMTVHGTRYDLDALAQEIADANPAGGSITINGQRYVWVNFESLVNLLHFIESNPQPCAFDGRINAFDCHAPIALYYHPLQVWGVDPTTGEGTFAFSVSQEQIDAAGIPASGTILIVQGTHPVTGLPIALYRHANGTFQINAFFPDMKPYVGIWMEYGGFTNLSGEQG